MRIEYDVSVFWNSTHNILLVSHNLYPTTQNTTPVNLQHEAVVGALLQYVRSAYYE